MLEIEQLEKEHEEIRLRIFELLEMNEYEMYSIPELIIKLQRIAKYWNSHEKEEEKFFKKLTLNKIKFPVKQMYLQHRQINGHWKVIQNSIKSKNLEKVKIAMETDGKMFTDKLLKHIEIEENLFNTIPEH